MTVRRGPALIVGMVAGGTSLAAAVWAGSLQANAAVLSASRPAQTVPIPREFMPSGMRVPALQPPLTADQRDRTRVALWRDPLDQKLVNTLYVDAVRRAGNNAATRPAVRTLAGLGWRYTPAQQNLMMRAAYDARFGDVIDRADALLRRQKLTDQAITMLVAMEAIPQVHDMVVGKLLGEPMWRHDYLLRIGPQAPTQILDARIHTMRVLLRKPDGVSRAELAPTLQALVGAGRARDAYDLWAMKAGAPGRGNLIRDPDFRFAAALAGDDTAIPFEWRMNQSLGYSADANGNGATVTWDGRGVPVFMNQLVLVTPGRSYMLTIEGRADVGALRPLLVATLGCGAVSIAFVPVDGPEGAARFRSAPIPSGCDIADVAIGGDVDAGRRAVVMEIGRVALQPAG